MPDEKDDHRDSLISYCKSILNMAHDSAFIKQEVKKRSGTGKIFHIYDLRITGILVMQKLYNMVLERVMGKTGHIIC